MSEFIYKIDYIYKPKERKRPMTKAEMIRNQFKELGEKVAAKNTDYGESVFEPPTLCPHLAASSAILVRLSDKFNRLKRLINNTAEVKEESIADTLDDICGYSVLLKIQLSEKNS